jgi:hypothetical protein
MRFVVALTWLLGVIWLLIEHVQSPYPLRLELLYWVTVVAFLEVLVTRLAAGRPDHKAAVAAELMKRGLPNPTAQFIDVSALSLPANGLGAVALAVLALVFTGSILHWLFLVLALLAVLLGAWWLLIVTSLTRRARKHGA